MSFDIGSVISAGINQATTWGNTVLQDYYNRKAASRSQDYMWSLWNANNAYNSPKSQMERYQEAGLNPNLIYGSGSASAGNASGGNSATVQPPRVDLGSYLSMEAQRLNNDNLRQQNRILRKDAEAYEKNNIRPDTSLLGQLVRLLNTDETDIQRMVHNAKELGLNLYNGIRNEFNMDFLPPVPGKVNTVKKRSVQPKKDDISVSDTIKGWFK